MRNFQYTKNNPRFHPRKMWISGVIIAILTVFCGQLAKVHLQNLIGRHDLRCERMPAAKKETRTVARCFIGELDVGREMVRGGWAIDYRYFSKGFYAEAEKHAREQKKWGLGRSFSTAAKLAEIQPL